MTLLTIFEKIDIFYEFIRWEPSSTKHLQNIVKRRNKDYNQADANNDSRKEGQ